MDGYAAINVENGVSPIVHVGNHQRMIRNSLDRKVHMIHELKILPQYFCRVLDGSKTFEVRDNDRGFQPGDGVRLCEYDPQIIVKRDYTPLGDDEYREAKGYTGRNMDFTVGYVLPINDGLVVFSLLKNAPQDDGKE